MLRGAAARRQLMRGWIRRRKIKNRDIYPAKKFTRRITIKRWKILKKNKLTAA
jgi:hypothetical protein